MTAEPDLPRIYTIRESSHRIINAFSSDKLATLGQAIGLREGTRVLDLACGKGEMLATWARDHGITGTGVDVSTVFLAAARERVAELGVSAAITLLHGDAADHVEEAAYDVVCCLGAMWFAGGFDESLAHLRRCVSPGGLVLVGEPFWTRVPETDEIARACHASSIEEFRTLAGLVEHVQEQGFDVVEMVLADQDSWDRYVAAQWLNLRRFLEEFPDDELAPRLREELDREPVAYTRWRRDRMGWGVLVLKSR